jgi:hypothetical protein
MSATITAYAYETVANKIIEAECGTKSDIATGTTVAGYARLGADGLPLWRREEALLGI